MNLDDKKQIAIAINRCNEEIKDLKKVISDPSFYTVLEARNKDLSQRLDGFIKRLIQSRIDTIILKQIYVEQNVHKYELEKLNKCLSLPGMFVSLEVWSPSIYHKITNHIKMVCTERKNELNQKIKDYELLR